MITGSILNRPGYGSGASFAPSPERLAGFVVSGGSMIERDSYDEHMLSLNIEHAAAGSAKLERTMAGLFGRDKPQRWTRSFEKAVSLFEEEFGRERGDLSRECLANGCNGITWTIYNSETGDAAVGSGATDALALCAAMVLTKRPAARK